MKLKFFLIFLILIFSISVVSAGNYSDLQNEIDNSTNVLILNEDYTFDNVSDEKFVIVNKTNFTIEGNNHFIDANGMAGFFKINGNNITIQNLIFKNMNNTEKYGVFINKSSVILNNVIFTDINLEKGSSIQSLYSNLTIKNSIFKESYNYRSVIYSLYSDNLIITGSIFYDLKAMSSAVLCSLSANFVFIDNSRFYNIESYISSGALSIKSSEFKLTNCDFHNIKSRKNAGAIFIDADSTNKTTYISKCNFTNCSSGFGGALVLLQITNSTIENCNFISNFANYNGGAIYLSFTNLTIDNCNFINNNAICNEKYTNITDYGYGGALYIDYSTVKILNSNILNNIASLQGGALYIYESNISLININTTFNSKKDVYGIYAVFLNNFTSLKSVINDTCSLNNTRYLKVIVSSGMTLDLVNNTMVITNLTKFDLRDYGWVSSVKNQDRMGACWAFGAIGSIESALLKNTNMSFDFSENNMHKLGLSYYNIANNYTFEGADLFISSSYLLSWLGLVFEYEDDYDDIGKLSLTLPSSIHIQDIMFLPPRKNATDNDEIKKALINYGSIYLNFYFDNINFNDKTNAYYNGVVNKTNHGISIVGWDDNYSKDNFLNTPSGDGAFIIKNSWGDDWGEKGYFYISYYDISLGLYPAGVYLFNNTINYNKNYQVDFSGIKDYKKNFKSYNFTDKYYANKFISIGNDSIAAVGTYFNQSGVDYKINVFINGILKHSQFGISPYVGYSTIKLTQNITVCEGDEIFVSIKSNAIPVSLNTRVHLDKDTSFISEDGVNWIDMYNNQIPVCLKVYTVEYQLNTNNLTKYYGNNDSYIVNIGAVNKTVIFNINGANYTRITDENGVASLVINLQPGNYNITTYALGKVNVNTVTILSTVESSDIVKTYKNATKYVAKFLNTDGSPLLNTKVSFNINGVIYYKVTDSNGLASLAINLFPNNYVITTLNPVTNEFKSNDVVVLSTVISQDIVKYYRNGTQYVAQFLTSENKALVNTNVTFNINGVFYTRCTNSEGIAKLNINLNPGDYIITAYNPVTGELKSNNIKVLPVIIASDLEKTYSEVKSFKAQVIDGSGKPLSGQEVSFNINGVIYHKTTNSNGEAYLKINLNIGEYIITTYWNQTFISNKIKVI